MSLDSSAHSDSDDTIVVGLEATSEGILVASSSASVVPGFVLSDSLEGGTTALSEGLSDDLKKVLLVFGLV